MRVIPDPRESGTKRERTRNRLLVAAQQLLLERSAGTLTIRDISHQAELSHGSFYNYFETVEALLDNLALLFTITHGRHVAQVVAGKDDYAEIFALTTRQTLRLVAEVPDYGKYVFDAGLPLDYFVQGLRMTLRADIERGVASGAFHVSDVPLSASLVAGGMLGLALDLHRGQLAHQAIEDGTERLLLLLGVRAPKAKRLATAEVAFPPAPTLPLTWPRGEG